MHLSQIVHIGIRLTFYKLGEHVVTHKLTPSADLQITLRMSGTLRASRVLLVACMLPLCRPSHSLGHATRRQNVIVIRTLARWCDEASVQENLQVI